MQINISGQNIDVTDALKQFIEDKMVRIERHFQDITNAHVMLNVEKNRHTAEATLNTKGAQIFAESTSDDMYAAIDTLVDKLDRQAIKHKEKMKNHHPDRDQ